MHFFFFEMIVLAAPGRYYVDGFPGNRVSEINYTYILFFIQFECIFIGNDHLYGLLIMMDQQNLLFYL